MDTIKDFIMRLPQTNKQQGMADAGRQGRINTWGHATGRWINRILQRQTNRLSPRQLKVGVLLFVLLAGSGSAWVLVGGLEHSSSPINVPPPRGPTEQSWQQPVALPDDAAIRVSIDRIEAFHRRMDSLKNDPEGRILYDSLLRARPGLFDSIGRVERTYRLR
jgi:hypothetical protein